MLAELHFHRRDSAMFGRLEHALELNPNNPQVVAVAGSRYCRAGNWECGLQLARKAIALVPNPPGWFYIAVLHDHYRKREYQQALDYALKVDMPGYYGYWAGLAGTYGQLGYNNQAQRAVIQLLKLNPGFGAQAWTFYRKWFWEVDLIAHIIEGLRKVGLDIPDES